MLRDDGGPSSVAPPRRIGSPGHRGDCVGEQPRVPAEDAGQGPVHGTEERVHGAVALGARLPAMVAALDHDHAPALHVGPGGAPPPGQMDALVGLRARSLRGGALPGWTARAHGRSPWIVVKGRSSRRWVCAPLFQRAYSSESPSACQEAAMMFVSAPPGAPVPHSAAGAMTTRAGVGG